MKKNILNVVIIIFILILILYVWKISVKTSDTMYTYLLLEANDNMSDELCNFKQVITFDKNDICIDTRLLYEFKDEAKAKAQYNSWLTISNQENSNIKNVCINSTTVTFNTTSHNGSQKSEFLEMTNENEYVEI